MNATLCFGLRYALHAMGSGFELEPGKRATPDDATDDFLVAAMLARILAQDFHAPALRLGVARVHAKQVASEQCSFVSTGSGAHFEEDIVVITRIFRHQQLLQRCLLGFEPSAERLHLFLAECARRWIRIGRHLLRGAQVLLDAAKLREPLRYRFESRVLHGKLAEALLVGGRSGFREQTADLFEAFGKSFKFLTDRGLHDGARLWGRSQYNTRRQHETARKCL